MGLTRAGTRLARARCPVRLASKHTLDLAAAGANVPEWAITQALLASGDLDPAALDPGDVPFARRHRLAGQWERRHAALLSRATWLDVIAYCNPAQ
jgi:hypothetical protein